MKTAAKLLLLLLAGPLTAYCQTGGKDGFSLVIVNLEHQPVGGATVKMLRDGKPVRTAMAAGHGRVTFDSLTKGTYTFLISSAGYQPKLTAEYRLPGVTEDSIILISTAVLMQEATVTGRVPPVERKRDRTIINVEASPVNTGSTVLREPVSAPAIYLECRADASIWRVADNNAFV